MVSDILERVRSIAKNKILYLPHAIRQMAKPERMISVQEIRQIIDKGEVIEDYPEDARGRSCLLLGSGEMDRPIHIVCSPKDDYLAVITAYLPVSQEWSLDFRERKKK
jgi:uncharacterized protein DUF4258